MDFCVNLKMNFFYVSSKRCVFIEILFFSLEIMLCFLLDGLSLIFKFKDYPLTFPLSTMQLLLQILLQYRHIFLRFKKKRVTFLFLYLLIKMLKEIILIRYFSFNNKM